MTYRNPALTRLAKGQSCVACGAKDETVVWAHSNLLEHGKGRGIKAHDAAGMLLCARCHAELDQGTGMSRAEKREFTLDMIAKTHMRLWESGLVEVAPCAG
jgi:ferredoxin